MGLISYIKGVYYDHRIEKADELLHNGKECEAEEIYKELLGKQYTAVNKLASLYYAQFLRAGNEEDTNKEIHLFKCIKSLSSQGNNNYDIKSYNSTVDTTVRTMLSRANALFNVAKYQKCLDLMSAVNNSDSKSSDSINLACEANIMLLISKIKTISVPSIEFKTSLNQLNLEFNSLGKSIKRCEQTVELFAKELIDGKRYLAANKLLESITNRNHKDVCLSNAACIIDQKDTEASSNDLKEVVSKYGKELSINYSQKSDECIRFFNQCWKVSSSDQFVMDVLTAKKTAFLQEEIIKNILSNHTAYLSKPSLKKLFIDWIQKFSDKIESLTLTEKIHNLGYDVKEYYLKKVQEVISSLNNEDKLPYINHALTLFRNNTTMLIKKLEIARWYVSHNKNDEAIVLADEIGNLITGACLVKAEALFNKAKVETDLDRRVKLLRESLSSITSTTGTGSSKLIESVNELFIDTAELYYSVKDSDKAYAILHEQSNLGSERSQNLISCYRLKEITGLNAENKEEYIEKVITEIATFNNPSRLNDTSYQNIWDELSIVTLNKIQSLSNQEAINLLERYINRVDKEFTDKTIVKKRKANVIKELIKRKYLIARESELASNFTSAANIYHEISTLEAKKIPTLAVLRFILCKLKDYQNSDILNHKDNIYSVMRKASDTFMTEKKDIAYRFALILLKSGDIDESLSVLSEFLPEETYLKKACEQGYIAKALSKLDEFNHNLELIKNREMSSDDAIYFINHMLDYAEEIKPVLEISRPVLSRYRNKIKNYAISKLFDEGKYNVAFEKLKKVHSDYLDNLTVLRNIAIVCLNMAESEQLNDSNYKEVISVWLTAIYQEKLFIKSLDYTSWDNSFTFSLYDAFGHFNENTVGNLPENVILEYDSDEKVVMIKEVQRSLLDRFEAAISENQKYHIFFTEQKSSMDALVELNLDIKCKLVAPYLASSSEDIFEDITEALEHDRKEGYDNWEDVLAVGVDYGLQNSIYNDFKTANQYFSECIEALDSMQITKTKNAFIQSKLSLIQRFNKKYKALLSYTSSKISSLSAENKADFKNGFGQYSVVCNELKDVTLSYSFSNYVMRYVVEEVNEKRMSKEDASECILTVHLLDKTNTRVNDNLATLLSLLMQEYAQEGRSTALTSIKNILSKTRSCDSSLDNDLVEQLAILALISDHEDRLSAISSGISSYSSGTSTFAQKLNAKVTEVKVNKELNEIVERVNNNSINKSQALTKVYDIYCKYPNNSRICENLSTLCNMCIMEYVIGDKYGKSGVKSILDKLKINKSAEFNKHCSVFKKTHNEIWNQLPFDAQQLLKGAGLSYGQTLNDKGYALKEGLEYYRSLGGFSLSTFDDDIFSILHHHH